MIHEFDSVPWLLDDPLAAVTVFAPAVPSGALQDVQVAVLETVGGRVVTVEVSVNARYGYDIHTEVTGTRGHGLADVAVRHQSAHGEPRRSRGEVGLRRALRRRLPRRAGGLGRGRARGLPAGAVGLGRAPGQPRRVAAVDSLHGGGRVAVPHEQRPDLYA